MAKLHKSPTIAVVHDAAVVVRFVVRNDAWPRNFVLRGIFVDNRHVVVAVVARVLVVETWTSRGS